MRLFVGLWPPSEVADVLDGIVREVHPGVRWTDRAPWHVTRRFLGEVADEVVPDLVEALAGAGRRPARVAVLGPATSRLGRQTLVAPVAGVDDLGAAVAVATRAFGPPPEGRPFAAHVTLARGRGGGAVPPGLAGQVVEASWPVTDLALVRSTLSPHGARYQTVTTIALDAGASRGPR